jgi:hypothetical protein
LGRVASPQVFQERAGHQCAANVCPDDRSGATQLEPECSLPSAPGADRHGHSAPRGRRLRAARTGCIGRVPPISAQFRRGVCASPRGAHAHLRGPTVTRCNPCHIWEVSTPAFCARSGEGPGGGKSQSLQAAAAAVRVRNQHISRSLMPAEEISC